MDDDEDTDVTDVHAPSLARADRREVMLDAAEQLAELHRATLRLGDALVAAGWPGPEWRSRKATLNRLDGDLPDNTLDELITRLTDFAVNSGPGWLHGDGRDLDAFEEEARILGDVVHPLRRVAQHLRALPTRERGDLPIERAFGHALVATPLDRVAAILRDLEQLAPRLAPLAPEEWRAPPAPAPTEPESARGEPEADVWQSAHTRTSDAAGAQEVPQIRSPEPSARAAGTSQAYTRLRDFAPAWPPASARSAEPSTRALLGLLARRTVRSLRQLRHMNQRQRWIVSIGLVVVLALAVLLLQVARTPRPHSSALVATPAQVQLKCAAHPASAAPSLTLKNPGKAAITWQIQPPAALSIAPARGTLGAGQSAALRIGATGHTAQRGTIGVSASDGVLAIAYTITCP